RSERHGLRLRQRAPTHLVVRRTMGDARPRRRHPRCRVLPAAPEPAGVRPDLPGGHGGVEGGQAQADVDVPGGAVVRRSGMVGERRTQPDAAGLEDRGSGHPGRAEGRGGRRLRACGARPGERAVGGGGARGGRRRTAEV
ncbi:MAG: hypothetical protein AVDCRST_MAG10-2755, partial [uncultured Acidimicrobiales bacterium]